MNDSAIKNFATWARRELLESVRQRCQVFGIAAEGVPEADAQAVGDRVLTERERTQRAELLDEVAKDGLERLVDRAAYTWFNRLVAIRFMEVNDRLPSHVRVLSASDGGIRPQALDEAMDLPLASLDATQVARLVQAGDDEELFRAVFLAQCDELADCMPDIFEHVGSAMELLLPDGLLRQGGVVNRLVTDIPEDNWRAGVQIVGWMYQYYVSERKDEVFAGFKKGKKATRDSIAPATQLFTPDWIVRYLVENSLGRLWVLNHPASSLPQDMPYFVKPDTDHEKDFRHIDSPEEIRVVDPACGSGHILVYAFELLARMYAEAGYSNRDAARLIVEKNLVGLEIDPRAAELASFCVTMKALEYDGRFLRRGVTPKITVLSSVVLMPEELSLCPHVAARKKLVDAAAHLDECGSLFKPSKDDLDALAGDLASLAGAPSLFAARAADKLARLREGLVLLADAYDVVVANPPYMGSSNMGAWLAKWAKGVYPDSCRDLCTCFVERGFTLSRVDGTSAMITMQSWMFLGSFEKLRSKILGGHSIATMAHLGTRAFGAIGGEVVSTTATVFCNAKTDLPGSYLRLVDMGSEEAKRQGLLEALANPECGWFYRRSAYSFESIPGMPIGYWINERVLESYKNNLTFAEIGHPKVGMQTSNNDLYLRLWWEVKHSEFNSTERPPVWIKYLKGGDYRKWYGNLEYLVHYNRNPKYILGQPHAKVLDLSYLEKPKCTWTDLTSGEPSFRYAPDDTFYDISGHCFFPTRSNQLFLLAYANTSIVAMLKRVFNSSFHFQCGDLAKIVVPKLHERERENVASIAKEQVDISRNDWDSRETSWDFKRHPLV